MTQEALDEEETMLFGDFDDADTALLFSGDTAFRATPSPAARRVSFVNDESPHSNLGDAVLSPAVIAQVAAARDLLRWYADRFKSSVQTIVNPPNTPAAVPSKCRTTTLVVTPSSDNQFDTSSLQDSPSPPL